MDREGYRYLKQLGKGYFSTVVLAEHTLSKNKVAIKVLNKKRLADMEHTVLAKVWREIDIHKTLKHRHVIQLYEAIETDTDILVVLEYAPGRELFEFLVASGRLPEHDARKLFQQIIAALEYCHSKGITHRDLKPENILLDEAGNVKIADFGKL